MQVAWSEGVWSEESPADCALRPGIPPRTWGSWWHHCTAATNQDILPHLFSGLLEELNEKWKHFIRHEALQKVKDFFGYALKNNKKWLKFF